MGCSPDRPAAWQYGDVARGRAGPWRTVAMRRGRSLRYVAGTQGYPVFN
jgi:hypothetical protein